jgi:hypothetical protein
LEAFLVIRGSTLSHVDCTAPRIQCESILSTGLSIIGQETSESRVVSVTDKLRDVVGNTVQKHIESRTHNGLLDIVESGAKGNRSHIVQNAGIVGQQFNVHSKRYERLTSHDAPEASLRGFVGQSFSDGLGPIEYFHHLTSARIGLIGTAVSTAETGYCYRRISKCLEDIRVCFDHSIRNASGEIVMRNIGFSTDHVFLTHIRSIDQASLRNTDGMDDDERTHLEKIRAHYILQKGMFRKMYLPFDVNKLPGPHPEDRGYGITPSYMKMEVRTLWVRLCSCDHIPRNIEPAFFDYLSSHALWHDIGVRSSDHLCRILTYVEHCLVSNMYQPDTPIGLIASQSFSEPLTQIQLNRFHHSGEGSGLVSGVARIKEIINCMKTIQTPSMKIFVRPGCDVSMDDILEITLLDIMATWTDELNGHITIVLNRSFMIKRMTVPRVVANRLSELHPNSTVGYTTRLEDTTWKVWMSLPPTAVGTNSSTAIRECARALSKQNPVMRGIKYIRDYYEIDVDVNVPVDGTHLCKQRRRCMVTMGSNMREICKLPWVDTKFTTTNDLMELHNVMGIDAMCRSIEDNLMDVMTNNSASVGRKYIRIIAHEMCRTGMPCALTFAGLTQSKTSTLKLATFERSLESFTIAACEGHVDKLGGISESIIVGKPVAVGTGGCFSVVSVPTTGDATICERGADNWKCTTYDYTPIPNDITLSLKNEKTYGDACNPRDEVLLPPARGNRKRRKMHNSSTVHTTNIQNIPGHTQSTTVFTQTLADVDFI